MSSIWGNLYDRFKDRRYGILFWFSTVAFAGLVVLGAVVEATLRVDGLPAYGVEALAGVGLLVLAWNVAAFVRARRQRRACDEFPPLSSDEKRVARSKLVKNQNRNGV